MDLLRSVAEVAAALVAICGAVGLAARSRAGKWLWRKIAAEPFAEWVKAQLQPLHDKLEARDEHVSAIDEKVGALAEAVRPTNGDQRSISDRVDAGNAALTAHTAQDQRNFSRLAGWTRNFTQFDPVVLDVTEEEASQ